MVIDSSKDSHMKFNVQLTDKNKYTANQMLLDIAILFDKHNILYHLEGGTLLGIVRDQMLLPWDHDIDISVPEFEAEKALKAFSELPYKYRFTFHKNGISSKIFRLNSLRILKVKLRWVSLLSKIFPFFFIRSNVVLDIFVKSQVDQYVYWQAAKKIMRVDKKFYTSFEEIHYNGYLFKVPNLYREYLTEKYGDWSVPVKNWDCSKDEKTIIDM